MDTQKLPGILKVNFISEVCETLKVAQNIVYRHRR